MLSIDSFKNSINSFFDICSQHLTPQNKKIIAIVSAVFCALAISYALIKYKSGQLSFYAKKEEGSKIDTDLLPKKDSPIDQEPDPLTKEENDVSINTDPLTKKEDDSNKKSIALTDPRAIHEIIYHEKLSPIALEYVETFLKRGGKFHFIKDDKSQLLISKSDNNNNPINYIVGCTSGQNRSQALGAFLKSKECNVSDVLAGADSEINPWVDFPIVQLQDDENFKKVFSHNRMLQLGFTYDGMGKGAFFYIKYFAALRLLTPTHFLCFGQSTVSVIHRLVETGQEDLSGFNVTHFSWGDTIQHPEKEIDPSTGDLIKPKSIACYEAFKAKLEQTIKIN